MFSSSISVFLFVSTLLSTAIPHSEAVHEVFEALNAVPLGWSIQDGMAADPSSSLNLRLHLKQQNVAEFEQIVYDISTPGHQSYSAHMSQYSINSMLRPADETLQLVTSWLLSSDLKGLTSSDSNVIYVNATVGVAERILDAKYVYFRHEETGNVILRTMSYGLPQELHEHIDMVYPTTYFPSTRSMKIAASKPTDFRQAKKLRRGMAHGHGPKPSNPSPGLDVASCNITVTPDCVKALYGFADFHPPTTFGNKFGIAGYLEEYVRDDDLAIFEEIYANQTTGTLYDFVSVNGGLNTQYWGQDTVESAIDLQYGIALNYPTPVTYYQTAGSPPINLSLQTTSDDSEPYLQWLTFMLSLNETSLPQVISTSYADEEQTVPLSYAKTVCNLFAQLAARGVSCLFATGDSGPGQICISNDGKNTTKFLPTFPASCPFVTAVGATQHIEPEIGVSFSGGGFSEYFPRPQYQDAVVEKYLEKHGKEWAPYFNSSGRGYPDVSAQGTNVSIIYWGGHRYEAGTSCSTPIFASVISLINADRLSKGMKALGFLNPWLYSVASEGLRDIVGGRSSGCTSTYPGANITEAGWDAVVGWDPATGLGTPDFKKLLGVSRGGDAS